ncbi:hypothetical protein ACSBR2_037593 [Camellia fascicularis]
MLLSQIVNDICGKFDGLVPGVVCLLFDVPGYKRFKVVSDDDINNMLCLGKSFGLKHIKVIVHAPSGGVGGQRHFCRLNGRMGLPMWDNVLMGEQMNSEKFYARQTGCMWSVHARMLPSTEVLCIMRFDSVHSCGAAVRTYRNPRTGSDLVSTVVADRVRNQPLTRPMDVVFDLRNEYGLEISYRVAWLGVEKARGEVYGDHAMSFD